MRFNALSKVLVVGLGCGLVAAACSAPDPGAYELSDKTPRVGGGSTSGTTGGTSGQTSSGTSGTTSGSSGTTSGTSGTSSGTSGAVDAGKDTGTSGTTPAAFQGAPPYAATEGQPATNAGHGTADNLPPNHNCTSCHKNGGAANEMTMGGFVKNAGGAGIDKAEVRVVDNNGQEVAKAYTETNGYFYILGTALTGGPYKVGVRNGQAATGMVATITIGGCGTGACHGGSQGDTHLP